MKYFLFFLFFIPTSKGIREYRDIGYGLDTEFKINQNEFIAYVTLDDKLIATSNEATFISSKSLPLKIFNGKVYVKANVGINYNGSIKNRFGLFVPIKAMIHSHNPQCELPVIGIEEASKNDKEIANKYKAIKHFIYGCGWLAEFNYNGVFQSYEIKYFKWDI